MKANSLKYRSSYRPHETFSWVKLLAVRSFSEGGEIYASTYFFPSSGTIALTPR